MINKEELEYFMEMYPELTEEEVIEILEAVRRMKRVINKRKVG